MTQIDQFESIFRAASKTPFAYADWQVRRILTICDGTHEDAKRIEAQLKRFLAQAIDTEAIEWLILEGPGFQTVKQLIDTVHGLGPDLICCQRNLHVAADEFPYSLGVYVEVLTQITDIPVLLLPTEDLQHGNEESGQSKKVIAITDHLDDDALIVNSAIKLTARGGKLILAHIEDERAYFRVMHAIEKIAEIDSDTAQEKIKERLMADPRDFAESCRAVIEGLGMEFEVESVVKMGHSLNDYKQLVQETQVDLVVMHTKDDDQLAMHGLAYPLTIELHQTPMLLI